MKVSLIIPMYNESSIIVQTAQAAHAYMSQHFASYEILFFDDGSSDGCGDIVRELALPHMRVCTYDGNKGKGAAVRCGMLEADGDIRIFTDADLAYGLEVVGRFAEVLEGRPELGMLIGSRNLHKDGYEGYTLLRRIMSKVYIRVLCLVGGFRLSDSQCGIKGFRAEAAQQIFSRCTVDGFAFDFEAILWANSKGIAIGEEPVKVINHRASKVRVLRDTLRMLRDLRQIRKRVKKSANAES